MLFDFDGQLSLNDILSLTYKEIGYLRKHRMALKQKHGPTLKDLRM